MANPFEKAFLASAANAPDIFEMFESRRKEEERERAAIAAEKRASGRVEAAKLARVLESLASASEEVGAPLSRALTNLKIPLTEQREGGVQLSPGELVREAAGIDQKPLTAMDAIRQGMPQGEIGTLEDQRAKGRYLSRITGEYGRLAGPEERRRLAMEKAGTALDVAEFYKDREQKLWKERTIFEAGVMQNITDKVADRTATRSEKKQLVELMASHGEPPTAIGEAIGDKAFAENPSESKFYRNYRIGGQRYKTKTFADNYSWNIDKLRSAFNRNLSLPINPYSPATEKHAYEGYEHIKEMMLAQPDTIREKELSVSAAELRKMQAEHDKGMKYAQTLDHGNAMKQAQRAFDDYKDRINREESARGGAGITRPLSNAKVISMAVQRGIDVGAYTSSGDNRRYSDVTGADFDYKLFKRMNEGWFDIAAQLESGEDGVRVPWNTSTEGLRTMAAAKGISIGETKDEKALDKLVLAQEAHEWIEKINADGKRLPEVPANLQPEVKRQLIAMEAPAVSDWVARKKAREIRFGELAATQGLSPGVRHLTVAVPVENQIERDSIDQRTGKISRVRITHEPLTRPGVVLNAKERKKAAEDALTRSGWVYDKGLKTWVFSQHVFAPGETGEAVRKKTETLGDRIMGKD